VRGEEEKEENCKDEREGKEKNRKKSMSIIISSSANGKTIECERERILKVSVAQVLGLNDELESSEEFNNNEWEGGGGGRSGNQTASFY